MNRPRGIRSAGPIRISCIPYPVSPILYPLSCIPYPVSPIPHPPAYIRSRAPTHIRSAIPVRCTAVSLSEVVQEKWRHDASMPPNSRSSTTPPRLGAATEHPLRGPEAPSAKDLPLRCRTLSSPRSQSPIRQYVGCGKTHPTSSPSLPRPYLRFWGGRSRRHRLQQPPKLPYANKGAKNSTFNRPVSGTPHPKIAYRPRHPSSPRLHSKKQGRTPNRMRGLAFSICRMSDYLA